MSTHMIHGKKVILDDRHSTGTKKDFLRLAEELARDEAQWWREQGADINPEDVT